MNKYEARIKNAKAIHERIICLLDKGFMIWDELGQNISKVDVKFAPGNFSSYTKQNSLWLGEDGATTLFFCMDKNEDGGIHTSIEDFNKRFQQWKMFEPKNIIPFTLK